MKIHAASVNNSKVVRVFANFELNLSAWSNFVDFYTRTNGPIPFEIFWNESGTADLVIVLDSNLKPKWVRAPRNRIVKVLREPRIRSFWTHRFTYHHEKYYSHILVRTTELSSPREFHATPLIYAIGFPVPMDHELFTPNVKTNLLSVVASALDELPGHRARNRVVNFLEAESSLLDGHIYGYGRPNQIKSKLQGLLPYQYSLAIENTREAGYISEKFTDCILTGTVPLYFGAPDISDFFPCDSYIALNSLDSNDAYKTVSSLVGDDYGKRTEALKAARNLIVTKFNIVILMEQIINEPSVAKRKSILVLFGLDSALVLLHNFGSVVVGGLPSKLATVVRSIYKILLFRKVK